MLYICYTYVIHMSLCIYSLYASEQFIIKSILKYNKTVSLSPPTPPIHPLYTPYTPLIHPIYTPYTPPIHPLYITSPPPPLCTIALAVYTTYTLLIHYLYTIPFFDGRTKSTLEFAYFFCVSISLYSPSSSVSNLFYSSV